MPERYIEGSLAWLRVRYETGFTRSGIYVSLVNRETRESSEEFFIPCPSFFLSTLDGYITKGKKAA